MTDHAIMERPDGQIRCRCGELFATDVAHEIHFRLEAAAVVAPAGIAEARAALRGDRGAVEWGDGTSVSDRQILRLLVGIVASLLVVLAAMGDDPVPESPDPMTYQEEGP